MTLINHIAIIMDGNGRWGLKNRNSRIEGHKEGIRCIKPIVSYCCKNNIKILTLYALSYDNFLKRKKVEINSLLSLFEEYLSNNLDFFVKKKIKINFFGEKKNLSKKINYLIKSTEAKTNFKKSIINLNIAFNYSSKKEIINSFKKIIKKKLNINTKNIEKNLYTSNFLDPDILIRTGSHRRMSDFLLWQCSYTELFFVKKMWPDFKTYDLRKIISNFDHIKRNFGS